MFSSGSARAVELSVAPYVQDARPDGFTVVFETDRAARGAVEAGGRRVETAGTHHEARLDGLPAGTRLRYRVFVDGMERAANETITAPAAPRPFTFVVYGDTRGNREVEPAIVALARAESPDLALHTGDLVGWGSDEGAWRSFLTHEAPLMGETALYPAVGNHELFRDSDGEHYKNWFVLPDGGRSARHYAFSWAGVRFIALDGNVTGPAHAEETAWLERELTASAGAAHIFVYMHQPPLSMGGHCGAGEDDRDWVELFEKHRVRAVFAGHDHAYQRLERNGVRYFVTGGGGARLYDQRDECPEYDHDASRAYVAEHHLLRVRVDGNSVEVAALRPNAPPIETVRFDSAPEISSRPAPPIVGGPPRHPPYWVLAVLLLAGGGIVMRRMTRRRRVAA